MRYGSYEFSPVPFITSTRTFDKTANGVTVGSTYKLTLNGTLVSFSGSYLSVDTLQDQLNLAMSTEGQEFVVICSGSGVSGDIYRTYPRILSLNYSPSPDNWVYTTPYTIELEFDFNPITSGVAIDPSGYGPFIRDFNEQWTIEVVEDDAYYYKSLSPSGILDVMPSQYRVTHNVQAVGKSVYSSGVLNKQAWEQARDYILPYLGFDNAKLNASGVLNICDVGASGYNYVRVNQVDETGGSFAVQESWLFVHPSTSGYAGRAIENFVATAKKDLSSDIFTVTVEGSIIGLESRSYRTSPCTSGLAISETKYDAALDYWNNLQAKLYSRAVTAANGANSRSMNTAIFNSSVGHNPTKGTINYTYEYNDRPSNCIAGSTYEDITIEDIYQTDAFASLLILGRAAGPLFQGLGTYTEARRILNIELIYAPTTSCSAATLLSSSPKSAVDTLINSFYTELTTAFGSVWKVQDQQSWSPKTGKYSRTVGWAYGACT